MMMTEAQPQTEEEQHEFLASRLANAENERLKAKVKLLNTNNYMLTREVIKERGVSIDYSKQIMALASVIAKRDTEIMSLRSEILEWGESYSKLSYECEGVQC